MKTFDVTVTLPAMVAVEVRKQAMSVDMESFKDLKTMVGIWTMYGLGRWFNDGSTPAGKKAPAKDTPEYEAFARECLANAVAKLRKAYEGEYSMRGEAKEPADPVAAEARRIALAWANETVGRIVKEEWKATPEQAAKARAIAAKMELDMSDSAKMHAAIVAARAKRPEVIEAARKIVETRAATVTADDDLGV